MNDGAVQSLSETVTWKRHSPYGMRSAWSNVDLAQHFVHERWRKLLSDDTVMASPLSIYKYTYMIQLYL